ncbi:MAG: hypothetical protein ACD_24C00006G0004 [uncultured bacterium]|nr:MAG: hypothetical protein ACD_24C00006G0004 [uncultured bacterium]KKQ96379.1 MAG: dTDP 4-dehydrorhamnose reductase (DTDP-L-rhamnose synthetase) [Candidatus Levybacteria bacterium GW2011_GWA1_39_11]KKR25032.1 MAG: dTDP 4-dehydrorhamnose reductase (DTDP-L-rhamnose synthetase) [Candidatus Levybacteria bacterium GW2011_GWB1_39_7]KKR27119.1 MAG: dTDP-4-dehydrorhamnose reductase, dTDP-4-dehydrorhamnose reductase [Microgenomates group bacterium GW2011_GWC1_39_7]OGH15378.1 MAG: hypothetical protein 
MKILLIGKNGQIGREILKLGSKKNTVVALSKKELDITNWKSTREVITEVGPEVVINGSGYHVVSDCENFPDKAFELNTFALKNLSDICAERKITVVNFSTDKVFDGKKNKPYKEKDEANPLQVYGMSKLAGEIVAHSYCDKAITIRTCGVYGGLEGSRAKKGNFVLMIINESKNKKSLEISSEQFASFINAEDLARITLELLSKKVDSGIYHVVNEGYASWAEFGDTITKIANLPLTVVPKDRLGSFSSVKIPLFAGLDVSKIKSIGIKVKPWQDGLKEYISFLRSQNVL